MSKTNGELTLQKVNALHDKISDIIIKSGVTPTEATTTVIHVLCNLGVGELDLKNQPTLFNPLPNDDPCLSVRSICKRVKVNVIVGDDLGPNIGYDNDSPVVTSGNNETNKDLN